ncbi:MAG: type II CAAX endopeptidase family protein [Phycisphaerales bacterium]
MSIESPKNPEKAKTARPARSWGRWGEGIWISAVSLLMMFLIIVVWPGQVQIRIVAFLVLPFALLYRFARRPLRDYGLDFRNVKGQVRWTIYAYLLALPAVIVFSQLEEFQQFYGFSEADGLSFLFKILVIHCVSMFAWEFLLRGFLLFALAHHFGWWAVILQEVIIFPAAHVGKPLPEIMFSAIAGIIFSVAAYRSKSFLPAFVAHWWLAATHDAIVFVQEWGWEPILRPFAN